ncbi:MAG: CPXCG motif-containing cysteine-rich protein, partial [bacterium]
CPHCGESIQVAVDPTGGDVQTYIEDCPVCCNPNLLRVRFDPRGEAQVTAEAAQ